jgi:anti-sigma regulatory factor (Ser/Thr protein kinase)
MRAVLRLIPGPGATSRMQDFVSSFAAHNRVAPDDATRIMIMLEELLTNLDKYGRTGSGSAPSAEIAIFLDGADLTVELTDDGAPFDPLDRPVPDLDLGIEDRAVGGLGLFLVGELSHEASYRYADGRNLVRLMRHVALV